MKEAFLCREAKLQLLYGVSAAKNITGFSPPHKDLLSRMNEQSGQRQSG